MSSPTIMTEEPITALELQDALTSIQERDGELSFRAGKTVDHLNHSVPNDSRRKELSQAIAALEVPRLKPLHIAKILDIMPRNVKELGVVLSGYTLTVNKEYQQKIIDALHA